MTQYDGLLELIFIQLYLEEAPSEAIIDEVDILEILDQHLTERNHLINVSDINEVHMDYEDAAEVERLERMIRYLSGEIALDEGTGHQTVGVLIADAEIEMNPQIDLFPDDYLAGTTSTITVLDHMIFLYHTYRGLDNMIRERLR